MSKRKAEVNDIIYEINSEDLSSSSDEEQNAKRSCKDTIIEPEIIQDSLDEQQDSVATVKPERSSESALENVPLLLNENGGKSLDTQTIGKPNKITVSTEKTVSALNLDDSVIIDENNDTIISVNDSFIDDQPRKPPEESTGADILNDDIEIDSQSSPQIPIGCANRSPLISMTFKNKKLAKDYKHKIKEFMLRLIRLHDEESTGSGSETDLELDIWPEDLVDDGEIDQDKEAETENLFFLDTDPGLFSHVDVPEYSKNDTMLEDRQPEDPVSPVQQRRGPTCFNCDGAHPLRDCTLPRNNAKINEKRKAVNANRVGRYHVEDEQKFGHLVPGRLSGALRHALGLRRDEIPLYIYRMRMLGYPPGWLEEARISHSGITMFDSMGHAIQDPEEEDGEVSEPGSKDKYDIKKVLDFPGYNVPVSSRYKEEAHRYGLPPMSEEDSKLNMLQVLAPNAMKAYKRKKLSFFPSASSPNCTILGQAEMELDDGDETAEFPSVPPLPDEAPPPPPPTPPPPPPQTPPPPESPPRVKLEDTKTDDLIVLDVTHVKDIPLPAVPVIDLDGDDSNTQSNSGRDSPSLQDLEARKRLLLEALDSPSSIPSSPTTDKSSVKSLNVSKLSNDSEVVEEKVKTVQEIPINSQQTPKSAGHVKATSFGTPVLNTASPYLKLPSDNNFAKGICDVINFENLPDSTGKYKKICSLMKRVKSEVDRIQES